MTESIHVRTIICSPKWQFRVTHKYTRRLVQVSHWCPDDWFYYFNSKGRLRAVDLKHSIILECDYEKGCPYMKKLRDYATT